MRAAACCVLRRELASLSSPAHPNILPGKHKPSPAPGGRGMRGCREAGREAEGGGGWDESWESAGQTRAGQPGGLTRTSHCVLLDMDISNSISRCVAFQGGMELNSHGQGGGVGVGGRRGRRGARGSELLRWPHPKNAPASWHSVTSAPSQASTAASAIAAAGQGQGASGAGEREGWWAAGSLQQPSAGERGGGGGRHARRHL